MPNQTQGKRTIHVTLPPGAKDSLRRWCDANGYKRYADLVRELLQERTGIDLTPDRGGYRQRKPR